MSRWRRMPRPTASWFQRFHAWRSSTRSADISRETRIKMLPGRAAMIPMISHCILATRAHGLEILDGPYSEIANSDGFATECAQGRDLGFDGKTLIHPSHIEACNAIFTPPAEEVEQARKIIAAFEKPENASR